MLPLLSAPHTDRAAGAARSSPAPTHAIDWARWHQARPRSRRSPWSACPTSCRPRRQIPASDLLRRDGDALKGDVRVRCQLLQRLLDLLPGIDTGWIEVAEMVDEGRNGESVDVLGGSVEEREAGIAARHHERHVE